MTQTDVCSCVLQYELVAELFTDQPEPGPAAGPGSSRAVGRGKVGVRAAKEAPMGGSKKHKKTVGSLVSHHILKGKKYQLVMALWGFNIVFFCII